MEPKGRLARWIMDLQEFQFTTDHRPGLQNGNADALSRLETEHNTTTDKTETRQSHRGSPTAAAVGKPDSQSSQKQEKRKITITLILQKEPTNPIERLSQDTFSISNDRENTDKTTSNSTESSSDKQTGSKNACAVTLNPSLDLKQAQKQDVALAKLIERKCN